MLRFAGQSQKISPTISRDAAADALWDAVVIGAGVAGGTASQQLASRGVRVLLVDRATFPRDKVCGCCLNAHALSALDEIGLASALSDRGAKPLSRFQCYWRGRKVELPVAGGAALSRSALDAVLVESAIAAGADFVPATTASLGECAGDYRQVVLSNDGQNVIARARLVIAADGLSGHAVRHSRDLPSVVQRRSRIGAHAILPADDHYPGDAITMVCGRGGYVGLVRLEDDRLNVAGAFDVDAVRRHGGPGYLAAEILKSASLPIPDALAEASWHGTPRMTCRRTCVAAERLLIVGDAAEYVEPFTGEGMAWAVQSARLAAGLALEAVSECSPEIAARWNRLHRQTFRRRQQLCYATTRLLRSELGIAGLFAALRCAPRLAESVVRFVHGHDFKQSFTPQTQSNSRC